MSSIPRKWGKNHEQFAKSLETNEPASLLTPTGDAEKRGKHWMVRCLCACGNEVWVYKSNLKSGHSRSCGCLAKKLSVENNTTHGEAGRLNGTKTPEYEAWSGMKRRCLNPSRKDYPNYGGRGIRVCDAWVSSYEQFLADVGRRPSPLHSLDRIDVNGNYEPGNVRWATKQVQNSNNRANRYIEFNDKTQTLLEWSRELGINHSTIVMRLNKYGWTVERAFTETPRSGK